MRIGGFCRAAAALGAAMFLGSPAPTQERTRIPLLGRIESGLWELRSPSNALVASICVGDRILLTQPQHGDSPCTRLVISADARSATVHYTCPAAGFGRTTIRVETPRLVQIHSQGIYRNAPFGLQAEARRIGPCRPARS